MIEQARNRVLYCFGKREIVCTRKEQELNVEIGGVTMVVTGLFKVDAIGTDVYGLQGATAIPTHKSFPIIAAGLLRRGFSETDVAKIVGGNCMRLFHQVKETRG